MVRISEQLEKCSRAKFGAATFAAESIRLVSIVVAYTEVLAKAMTPQVTIIERYDDFFFIGKY